MKIQTHIITFVVITFCMGTSSLVAQSQDFSTNRPSSKYRGTAGSYASSSSSLASTIRTAQDGSPIIPCVVQLISDIDVPALETGWLKEIPVIENQAVEKSQIVAMIDDQISQRQLELAQLKYTLASKRATDETPVEAAKKKLSLTTSEYETNYKLYLKGSKTKQEAQRSLYSRQISEHELQSARNDQMLAAIEANAELVNVNAAKDSIQRHQIKSPIGGHIFKIDKDPGEWVNAGERIMRIAPLDRLRVSGNISAKDFDPHEIDGKPVTVTATLARGRQVEFTGNVIQTELEQRGSNLYLVIAEVDNRLVGETKHWILQPQSRVDMNIHVERNVRVSTNPNSGKPPTRMIGGGD